MRCSVLSERTLIWSTPESPLAPSLSHQSTPVLGSRPKAWAAALASCHGLRVTRVDHGGAIEKRSPIRTCQVAAPRPIVASGTPGVGAIRHRSRWSRQNRSRRHPAFGWEPASLETEATRCSPVHRPASAHRPLRCCIERAQRPRGAAGRDARTPGARTRRAVQRPEGESWRGIRHARRRLGASGLGRLALRAEADRAPSRRARSRRRSSRAAGGVTRRRWPSARSAGGQLGDAPLEAVVGRLAQAGRSRQVQARGARRTTSRRHPPAGERSARRPSDRCARRRTPARRHPGAEHPFANLPDVIEPKTRANQSSAGARVRCELQIAAGRARRRARSRACPTAPARGRDQHRDSAVAQRRDAFAAHVTAHAHVEQVTRDLTHAVARHAPLAAGRKTAAPAARSPRSRSRRTSAQGAPSTSAPLPLERTAVRPIERQIELEPSVAISVHVGRPVPVAAHEAEAEPERDAATRRARPRTASLESTVPSSQPHAPEHAALDDDRGVRRVGKAA